jgi:hypothetical protein
MVVSSTSAVSVLWTIRARDMTQHFACCVVYFGDVILGRIELLSNAHVRLINRTGILGVVL